jgi:hypothetical protein
MDITPGVRGAPARWAAYPTLGIQEKIPPPPVNTRNWLGTKYGWPRYTETWLRPRYSPCLGFARCKTSGIFICSKSPDGFSFLPPGPRGLGQRVTARAARIQSSPSRRHCRPSKSRPCVLPCQRQTNPHHLNGVRSTFASGSPSLGRVRPGGLFRAK